MTLLLNLLKAFAIAVGAYLLLIGGIFAIVWIRFGFKNPGNIVVSLAGIIPFFLVALAALYLPPQGRLYTAIGMLLLIVGIWVWAGITIFNTPNA